MRGYRRRRGKAGFISFSVCFPVVLMATVLVSLFQDPPVLPHVLIESSLHSGLMDVRALVPVNITLAVATLALNQGRYLREWIEFHRLMGFQLFLIFDDGSTDKTFDVLTPYVKQGTVVLVHARRSFAACLGEHRKGQEHQQARCQEAVFNYARSRLSGKVAWMGNFDVDEFVWTPRTGQTVARLLTHSKLASYDRIDLVGLVFGTSNVSEPSDGSVLEKFTRRAKSNLGLGSYHGPNFAHKSLYRPEGVGFVSVHLPWCVLCGSLVIAPLSSDIRLNHYQYKSRAEQQAKAVLNGNPSLSVNPEVEASMNEVEDCDILHVVSGFPVTARGHSPSIAP